MNNLSTPGLFTEANGRAFKEANIIVYASILTPTYKSLNTYWNCFYGARNSEEWSIIEMKLGISISYSK